MVQASHTKIAKVNTISKGGPAFCTSNLLGWDLILMLNCLFLFPGQLPLCASSL